MDLNFLGSILLMSFGLSYLQNKARVRKNVKNKAPAVNIPARNINTRGMKHQSDVAYDKYNSTGMKFLSDSVPEIRYISYV